MQLSCIIAALLLVRHIYLVGGVPADGSNTQSEQVEKNLLILDELKRHPNQENPYSAADTEDLADEESSIGEIQNMQDTSEETSGGASSDDAGTFQAVPIIADESAVQSLKNPSLASGGNPNDFVVVKLTQAPLPPPPVAAAPGANLGIQADQVAAQHQQLLARQKELQARAAKVEALRREVEQQQQLLLVKQMNSEQLKLAYIQQKETLEAEVEAQKARRQQILAVQMNSNEASAKEQAIFEKNLSKAQSQLQQNRVHQQQLLQQNAQDDRQIKLKLQELTGLMQQMEQEKQAQLHAIQQQSQFEAAAQAEFKTSAEKELASETQFGKNMQEFAKLSLDEMTTAQRQWLVKHNLLEAQRQRNDQEVMKALSEFQTDHVTNEQSTLAAELQLGKTQSENWGEREKYFEQVDSRYNFAKKAFGEPPAVDKAATFAPAAPGGKTPAKEKVKPKPATHGTPGAKKKKKSKESQLDDFSAGTPGFGSVALSPPNLAQMNNHFGQFIPSSQASTAGGTVTPVQKPTSTGFFSKVKGFFTGKKKSKPSASTNTASANPATQPKQSGFLNKVESFFHKV